MALSTAIPVAFNKNLTKLLVNFGPLTPKIMRLMFTYPKLTVHVLRMLMHLTLGHMTLLPGELTFSPIGPRAPGGLTLGFAPNL